MYVYNGGELSSEAKFVFVYARHPVAHGKWSRYAMAAHNSTGGFLVYAVAPLFDRAKEALTLELVW